MSSIGSVYRPSYRDKKTRDKKESALWLIKYSHNGTVYREPAKTSNKSIAKALLKERIGQAGLGKPVTPLVRRMTLDDLAELVLADYRHNGFDTLTRQEDAFNHQRSFRGGNVLAEEITTKWASEYREWRKEQPNGLFTRNPKIGCRTQPSIAKSPRSGTPSCLPRATRRRWSCTCPIYHSSRNVTDAPGFSSGMTSRRCGTICLIISSRL